MARTLMKAMAAAAVFGSILPAALAMAQARTEPAASDAQPAATATATTAATPSAAAPARQDGRRYPAPARPGVAAAFEEAGGSLFAASLAVQGADATRPPKASEVSLFHVPAPAPRVLKKHDLVTIIIREESEFSTEGNTDLKKEAALQASIEEWVKLNFRNFEIEGGGIGPVPPSVRLGGDRSFKGEAKVDRTDTFIGRITAEVVDVKPNETFVLQARKRIKTDEEEQEFVLTGIARARDLTPDNTLLSTQIYDLELSKTHRGQVRNSTKKGLVPRLIDFVNPL